MRTSSRSAMVSDAYAARKKRRKEREQLEKTGKAPNPAIDKVDSTPERIVPIPSAPRGPRVFIGRLPQSANESVLRKHFEKFGVANIDLLTRPNGRFKGAAFITFLHKIGATSALELDGSTMEGKRIVVQAAKGGKDAPTQVIQHRVCQSAGPR